MNREPSKRVLMTHPHDGHGPDDTCLSCQAQGEPTDNERLFVDRLANEIRRVDGGHSLGAGALAEALLPFLARRTGQGEPGERGGPIPLYGMLDVWMALYNTSHPEFDEFYAEHGYAETWARILAAVRERRTVDNPSFPTPPDGWFMFGQHAPYPWAGHMEFSDEKDETGMPLWERPTPGHRLGIKLPEGMAGHIVPCARCGKRAVVADDAENTEMQVCTACEKQIKAQNRES